MRSNNNNKMNLNPANTTTINALLVDDEAASRSLLTEMLKLYCSNVNLIGAANQISIARPYFDSHQIDLLFLDIEMPHGSGFDLLKQLEGYQFEVIFITGFDQYALEAIKVHALDYLLKPLDEDEFKAAVNKAVKRIQTAQPNRQIQQLLRQFEQPVALQSISIHTREKIILLRVNEIYYLKAEGACTFYFLTSGKRILSTKPLGKSMRLLPLSKNRLTHGFYRSHSSYAVNLFYAKEFDKKDQSLVLENGVQIPVAQSKKEQLMKLIA